MRGLEYIEDEDKLTPKAKKTSTKNPSKKSDHKHSYSIKKVVVDGVSNVKWEVEHLICDICGRKKQETKHI